MTKEELAAKLDGREIGGEITRDEAREAADAGLIVCYGASDDLVEIEGAVSGEVDAYDGGGFKLDRHGVIPSERDNDWSDDEMKAYFKRRADPLAVAVTAEWCPADENLSWRLSASVPFATFTIWEDGEMFCRGIVFDAPRSAA